MQELKPSRSVSELLVVEKVDIFQVPIQEEEEFWLRSADATQSETVDPNYPPCQQSRLQS